VGLAPDDYPTQRLLRVRVEGPEGGGSLRLIARIADPGTFQIEALDTVGRRLWRLYVGGGRAQMVDFRQRLACVSTDAVPLPDVGLDLGSATAALAVLLGRLPDELRLVESRPGLSLFVDQLARRWRVRTDPSGRLRSWTVLRDGEPEMWWRSYDDGENIVSHRAGAQVRWRQARVEELAGPLVAENLDREIPLIDCKQLLDQVFDRQSDGL
jgi:hypothetical protein